MNTSNQGGEWTLWRTKPYRNKLKGHQKMKRPPVFLDRQNGHIAKSDAWIWCNLHQRINDDLKRTRKKPSPTFIWKSKTHRITKGTLSKKNKGRGISIPNPNFTTKL